MRTMKTLILSAAVALGMTGAALASGDAIQLPRQNWSHNGIFGKIDQKSAQRGYQVFKEVCASCHSMRLVAFRNLAGIGMTEEQIKEAAASFQVKDGPNDAGEMFLRPGVPADRIPAPFANENAARAANNGSYPPDLSLMAKARGGGTDYIYALLTGYADPPADVTLMDGMSYNKYFPGHQIGMPSILSDGGVTYADGLEATAAQQAKDVATFITYASEPSLDARKSMGIKVILFLLVFSGLMYATKQALWRNVEH